MARCSARCVKCYAKAWDEYGHRNTSWGEPMVYSFQGTWQNVIIKKGPRGGFKSECKNCGHEWRVSHKTAYASGFKRNEEEG